MGVKKRLYYQTKEIKSFKTFKWVLKGRWNQGTGNSGGTRTYLQWDELGISYVGSDGVKYGPTYWTVDSFSSSGTPWVDYRGPADLFDGEWGSESSKCDYSGINDTDGYVEIIIHTTSGNAIIPNGVGLISGNNQSSYTSATPAHFILYGLEESTNEYVQIVDIPASDVNKSNNSTTVVNFEPIGSISQFYLLAPSDISSGSGLRYEVQDPPGPGPEPVDPLDPSNVPPNTIRCKFSSGYTPTMGDSQTLVDATENIWDITKSDRRYSGLFQSNTDLLVATISSLDSITNIGGLFQGASNLTKATIRNVNYSLSQVFSRCSSLVSVDLKDSILTGSANNLFLECVSLTSIKDLNTNNITGASFMFDNCRSLTSIPLFDTRACTSMWHMCSRCSSLVTVPLFDTSSCTNLSEMFSGCTSLTTIPLFNTSSCTNMSEMFRDCYNVQSGTVALYQQASTQATPPTSHSRTFENCGRDTITGAAELAQIPTDWGGTMS